MKTPMLMTSFRILLATLILAVPSTALAQTEDADSTGEESSAFDGLRDLDVPASFSGGANLTSGLYRAAGIDPRRPGQNWQLSLSPQLDLFWGLGMGVNVLLSSEGVDYRQNINQFGISPSWDWGTVHLGDFHQDFTPYTVQGMRLRGGGIDLLPGAFRFALQGGRVQRATPGLAGEQTYARYLGGLRLGYGRETASFLDLHIVKAKDDPGSLDATLPLRDTLLLDTIPEGLRPRQNVGGHPQENLVLGVAGRTALFDRSLVIEGEVSGALTTRDLASPRADPEAVDLPGFIDVVHPLHLSTSGDYAYTVDARLNLPVGRLEGGYQHVGPGYNSAGLAYLVSDRRSFHLGGATQLFESRVVLQGRFEHQNNNLLGQRVATTTRDVANATIALRATDALTTTVSALTSLVENDAAPDQGGLLNRARSLNANVAYRMAVLERPTVLSVMYGLHLMDGHSVQPIPETTVHNIAGSVDVRVSSSLSLAPSVSGVVREVTGEGSERNLLFGFRGSGRLLDGKLRTMANVSHNFSAGREIFGATARVSYPVHTGMTLALLARHNEYSAFAGRPAFNESFATLTLSTRF